MTIQIKAIVQYFPVVPFITPYKEVLTFDSVDEILKCHHSNRLLRSLSSTFLWCGLLCYAVRFESTDEIINYDRSNKSYGVVLYSITVAFCKLLTKQMKLS